jgi:hypothetical protein
MTGSADYTGAAGPGSATTHYNALDFMIQQQIAQLSTSTVVQIVKAPYDRSGNPITPGSAVPIGFVDVLPLVNQVTGNGTAVPHGTVSRLSYHRYQSGAGAFITDPVVGDQGLMVVGDRDTSVVKQTNAQGNPGSGRSYDKADGVYLGQCQGKTAPGQYFAFLAKGFNITDLYGNTIIGTQNGVLINGCLINRQGDVITKHGTDLDNHVNTLVTTGTDNSGPPP